MTSEKKISTKPRGDQEGNQRPNDRKPERDEWNQPNRDPRTGEKKLGKRH